MSNSMPAKIMNNTVKTAKNRLASVKIFCETKSKTAEAINDSAVMEIIQTLFRLVFLSEFFLNFTFSPFFSLPETFNTSSKVFLRAVVVY